MEYLKENIKNYFSDLTFEEIQHTYYLNNNPLEYSVSGLLKYFAPEFDAKIVSERLSKKTGVPQNYYIKDWKSTAQKAQIIGTETFKLEHDIVKTIFIITDNGKEYRFEKK